MPYSKALKSIVISSMLVLLAGCFAPRPSIRIPDQLPPTPKGPQPRVALVLGGGGARGIAHIGVLKVLQQEHIPIDLIVGTSAGSIVGSLYAADPNADRVQNIVMKTGITGILDVSPSWRGPVSGYALQNFLLRYIRVRNFNQLQIPFVAVTTDLESGRVIPIGSGPIAPAVNASAALPPVFQPVYLYGHYLVDGGICDLVPVDIALTYHPKIIIAVDVTSDLPRTMPTTIVGVFNRSYTILDTRTANYSMRGANIKLHPNVGQTGVFQSSNKADLIHAGEIAARKALPQICALLKANQIPSDCS
jgi:NTE family protein